MFARAAAQQLDMQVHAFFSLLYPRTSVFLQTGTFTRNSQDDRLSFWTRNSQCTNSFRILGWQTPHTTSGASRLRTRPAPGTCGADKSFADLGRLALSQLAANACGEAFGIPVDAAMFKRATVPFRAPPRYRLISDRRRECGVALKCTPTITHQLVERCK